MKKQPDVYYVLAWYCRATNGYHNVGWKRHSGKRLPKVTTKCAVATEKKLALKAFDLFWATAGDDRDGGRANDESRSTRDETRAALEGFLDDTSSRRPRGISSPFSPAELFFACHPQPLHSALCGAVRSKWESEVTEVGAFGYGRVKPEIHRTVEDQGLLYEIWNALGPRSGSDYYLAYPLDFQGTFQGAVALWGTKDALSDVRPEVVSRLPQLSWYVHEVIDDYCRAFAQNAKDDPRLLQLMLQGVRRVEGPDVSDERLPEASRYATADLDIRDRKYTVELDLPAREQTDSDEHRRWEDAKGYAIDVTTEALELWRGWKDGAEIDLGEEIDDGPFAEVKEANYDDIATVIGPSREPVLIVGESGTGKEEVAELVHDCSGYREGEFVAFNCASYPAPLIQARIFGYVRGAFTGAEKPYQGLLLTAAGLEPEAIPLDREKGTPSQEFTDWLGLEQSGKRRDRHWGIGSSDEAKGSRSQKARISGTIKPGTLFLDEVANLPPEGQGALLRVLDGTGFEPVGWANATSVRVDVRIVAATNELHIERMLDRAGGRDKRESDGASVGQRIATALERIVDHAAEPIVRADLTWRLAGWVVRTGGPLRTNIGSAVAAAWKKLGEHNRQGRRQYELAASAALKIRGMARLGEFNRGEYRALRALVARAMAHAEARLPDGRVLIEAEDVTWAVEWRLPRPPQKVAPAPARRLSTERQDVGDPHPPQNALPTAADGQVMAEIAERRRVVLSCAPSEALRKELEKRLGWEKWLSLVQPYFGPKRNLNKAITEEHLALYEAILPCWEKRGWDWKILAVAYGVDPPLESAWRGESFGDLYKDPTGGGASRGRNKKRSSAGSSE